MNFFSPLLIIPCVLLCLTACSADKESNAIQASIPWVKTVPARVDDQSALELSGVVRARFETPVAFQLSGRIVARHIDAGQQIKKGQILFDLDTRDLLQAIRSGEAEQAAARIALATATADVRRDQELVAKDFISQRALDRTKLIEQEASARLNAAQANLQQARNALGYANLRAEASGVLTEVNGEPGQVITFGQSIATLAHDGEREVEVFFPEKIKPRQSGSVVLLDGDMLPLTLRESAGAANPASRTWRARYRMTQGSSNLSLGEVVQTNFMKAIGATKTFKIPLGALDERGKNARIWQLLDGQAQPVPAQIVALDNEHAWVTADVAENSRIIALGTNLLKPGMAVQALAR